MDYIDNLIEKAFSDGYEYAYEEILFSERPVNNELEELKKLAKRDLKERIIERPISKSDKPLTTKLVKVGNNSKKKLLKKIAKGVAALGAAGAGIASGAAYMKKKEAEKLAAKRKKLLKRTGLVGAGLIGAGLIGKAIYDNKNK